MKANKGKGKVKTDGFPPNSPTGQDCVEALRRLVEHLQELNRWQSNLLAETMHRLADLRTGGEDDRPHKRRSRGAKAKS